MRSVSPHTLSPGRSMKLAYAIDRAQSASAHSIEWSMKRLVCVPCGFAHLHTLFAGRDQRGVCAMVVDPRRYRIIKVRQPSGRVYHLTIDGVLWSEVEWSSARRAWCVQDASGRCLAHCDAIHGQDLDAQTAVALARRMIIDGRMPAPEEASQQLANRLAAQTQQGRDAGQEDQRQGSPTWTPTATIVIG